MKLNGIFGTGSGKTGNAVFATSAGKQIVRTYQPKVTNPNTDAQVEQRAKFKLLSQLAAAMAPVIVIPKDGLVSARNRFVKINAPLTSFSEGIAKIILSKIQLTASIRSLSEVVAEYMSATAALNCSMGDEVYMSWQKVMYCLFIKTSNSKLQLVATKVAESDETSNPNASVSFDNLSEGDYVIYAYGMNAKNGAVNAGYTDYDAEVGATDARVETNKSISTRNYDFSVTNAKEITIG